MKTASRQHIEDCENKVELKIEIMLCTQKLNTAATLHVSLHIDGTAKIKRKLIINCFKMKKILNPNISKCI